MTIDLQPGDVFCVEGLGAAAGIIRAAERFWSGDNEAAYGHAGIISSWSGATYEALWTVRTDHLNRYTGQRILIARPVQTIYTDHAISDLARQLALECVQDHRGRIYPLWRLPLHLIKPAAKYIASGRWLVCSELVAKYLTILAARGLPYTGVNPDDLADEWRRWKNFDIIYEGRWPAT